ncbi:amino acid ABC transporter permease [Desulfohalovibrio reitneri]|uniref:amino acid ABC transporter permease n=1 Tax=Desulfohalovibrio reitneri TaxID=1307759 RepID=UPI0004A6CDA5|nr:amino acid ABC transporter permease [Desulfohalovibrio reitneri]
MSSGLLTRRGPGYKLFWRSAFIASVVVVIGLFYYASISVDYVWRWYNVPKYFIAETDIEVRAEVPGEIESITTKGEQTSITIEGPDGEETYTMPATGEVMASEGDFMYMGDVVGTYHETKPGLLLIGLWMTLKVSFIGIIFGVLLGLITGICRISDNPFLKSWSITYIELVRGTPLLVQIFIWYFLFGTLINDILNTQGLPQLPPLWFGVASLAFFSGAYVGEIVRAGIQSIHRGQIEAARSLGMNSFESMRHVILPQALRRILPPLAGQFISLVKDSSLLGIIAIRELTKATREIVTTSLQPFEMWIVCALLYLILTAALSLFTQYLERRMVQ